jgi:hypothetical protein
VVQCSLKEAARIKQPIKNICRLSSIVFKKQCDGFAVFVASHLLHTSPSSLLSKSHVHPYSIIHHSGMPPSLASMLAEEVQDWCKSNWSKIKVENITIANLKSLINQLLGGSKSFKKKAEGVVKLLQLINEKKVPEEREKPEEEPEEESLVSRRKGQKHSALQKEEEEKEEGEDKCLRRRRKLGQRVRNMWMCVQSRRSTSPRDNLLLFQRQHLVLWRWPATSLTLPLLNLVCSCFIHTFFGTPSQSNAHWMCNLHNLGSFYCALCVSNIGNVPSSLCAQCASDAHQIRHMHTIFIILIRILYLSSVLPST